MGAASTEAAAEQAPPAVEPLRHRVSLYLARVVKALADFEDALLKEDGFFARSDHFEAQVDTLRGEFEANERAQTIFSKPEPVQLLVGQLTCLIDERENEPVSARRSQQFVFAASVLLTAKTTVQTMLAHPPLLAQLWGFIKQPTRLHPVQLQYWCRCAGCILLSHRAASADLLGEDGIVRGLLRHLYSDSVSMLLKFLLGLPCVPGARVDHEPVVPLRAVVSGSGPLLAAAVRELLRPDDAAHDVSGLLCALCEHVPSQPDALECADGIVRVVLPLLPSLLALAVRPAGSREEAAVHGANAAATLQFLTACLQMEQRCEALRQEQLSCLPLGMLVDPAAERAGAVSLAARLLPAVPLLREQLGRTRSLLQLRLADLLVTYVAFAPASLRPQLALLGVVEAFVALFLQSDAAGGGRQDFVRHALLKGFRAMLASDCELYLDALVGGAELLPRMHHALTPEGARCCSAEHVRLLFVDLVRAASVSPTVAASLQRTDESAAAWRALQLHVNGWLTPCARPPSPPPAADELAAPAEPAPNGAATTAVATSPLRGSRRIQIPSLGCRMDDTSDDEDDVPLPLEGEDSENIDPNSPPPTPTRHKEVAFGERESPAKLEPPPREPGSPAMSGAGAGAKREAERPPTPRPQAHEGGACGLAAPCLMVESDNFRSAQDFSRDTPQPKLVRRSYLHRRAKEGSPFGSPAADSPAAAAAAESVGDAVVLLSDTVRSLSF